MIGGEVLKENLQNYGTLPSSVYGGHNQIIYINIDEEDLCKN
jgi:hypothetical protein